ncbi:MAG: peptidoglycan DD-metalloendopeptidase family protein [Gammaproteobacteria bacterium]|nr:peptidoglycan DD-metalloendopeptidase family protein [Gammaproteobacteria bacterium]MDH5777863.1 peptidoglycan DD-metalloendopeptidase family protein [Gammaproteobacteria bacterium]
MLINTVACGHKGVYTKGYFSGQSGQGQSDDNKVSRPAVKRLRNVHIVKKGETLYSLAWQYGHDYREVARWNNIPVPYTIYPEQKLRVRKPEATNDVAHKNHAKHSVTPSSNKPAPQQKFPGKLKWNWPTKGKVITTFSNSDPGRKGIDISGKSGQAIRATAAGYVVYSGSGLRGYGKLIILKHNETFFSAYAHNRHLLVKEGQKVKEKEQIADMGNTGADRVKLHFEIRRDGTPVNPLYYLPKQ